MSSELERRLEGFLHELPQPDPEVGERALAASLAAIQPVAPTRRGLRTAVVVFAAAFVLLAIAAGSLAAAGALHVSLGAKTKHVPAVRTLQLPRGANGIAAVVDGKLSVVTKTGFRLQGLDVSAAALSPHALYVAAGIGNSLVAMAPDGRRAWSHPAGGRIAAIAWAPDGFRIAYVVRTGRGLVLHVIWGNGTHDTVIDRSVRAVRPSWRADSLALAYVGGGGKAIVYDVAHESRRAVLVERPATAVAFGLTGDSIAVEQPSGLWLVHESAATHIPGQVEAFGWLGGRLAVVQPGLDSAVIRLFSPAGKARGFSRERGIVVAVSSKLLVVRRGKSLVAGATTLLTVARTARVGTVEIG